MSNPYKTLILTIQILYFFLCLINAENNTPSFGGFQSYFTASPLRRDTSPYKGYSGYVLRNDSLKMVYYYDQTIVVVEIGPKKQLLNCEIIEVYEENETINALEEIKEKVREPYTIDLDKMLQLMKQCQRLKTPPRSKFFQAPKSTIKPTVENQPNSITLLNGILPGTKWCGTGDIAENYYDLGTEVKMDKCCRTHDLCPSKIRAHTARYNVTNNSIYSKSHCTCDKIFKNCLRSTKNPTADLMGEFYFNLLRVPCIEDTPNGKKFSFPVEY